MMQQAGLKSKTVPYLSPGNGDNNKLTYEYDQYGNLKKITGHCR